jgi:hypothetical protein
VVAITESGKSREIQDSGLANSEVCRVRGQALGAPSHEVARSEEGG